MPRNHLNMVFVDRVVDLLQQSPNGLSEEEFLAAYYGNNLPNQQTCDQTWEEFKNAVDASNSLFDDWIEGYCWIRARRGLQNTWHYHVVARIENGEVRIIIPEMYAHQLDEQHTSEWKTRTRTKMRSALAAAEKLREIGMRTNNKNMVDEAEARLSEVIVISARLASVNFGNGIVLDDLRQLASSPRLSLLHHQIDRALRDFDRATRSIDNLARTVARLGRIAQGPARQGLNP